MEPARALDTIRSMETKIDYYRRRAAAEYLAHANAAQHEERRIHLEMAKHFEALALGTKVERDREEPGGPPVQAMEPPVLSN